MAGAEDLVKAASEELVEQLFKLAEHQNIYVSDKRLEENVRAAVRANVDEVGILKSKPVPRVEGRAAVSVRL